MSTAQVHVRHPALDEQLAGLPKYFMGATATPSGASSAT